MAHKCIYPGSFDPITFGHLDLIDRALNMFEEVVILVAVASQKKCYFTLEERMELIAQSLDKRDRVSVQTWNGLVVEYARKTNINVMLRGLRLASDFDYEFNMCTMNRELYSDLETILMISDKDRIFISSSMIKDLAFHGSDVSKYVPKPVAEKLIKRMAQIKKSSE